MRRLNKKTKPDPIFKCGVGLSQVAITPGGELKPCLMMDSARFKIKEAGLQEAWRQVKKYISGIKPGKNYRCRKCSLAIYCKWCPAKAWLYNRTFTSCDPECRRQAARSMASRKI